jgi:branched-subunit amino acid transport protein
MSAQEVVLIIGMALVTFGVRYPVLALVSRVTLPGPMLESLHFIPPAVLTAIIVPAMLMPDGTVEMSLQNAYLIGGLAAGLIAWYSRNLLLTICLGMAIFWSWRLLVGG